MDTSCTLYKPTIQLSLNEFRQAARYRLGATTTTKATFDADSATRSKTLAIKVCHTGTTQLNTMVKAPFTAATAASTRFFIILSRRLATVPRWKLRISYQAASFVLETSTCRLVMTAWQLHMTLLWSRLLWNRPYLRPLVLSASRRILL
jgi:hypothetical protein